MLSLVLPSSLMLSLVLPPPHRRQSRAQYLRRVGRVTRGARSPGRVTSLVLGRQLMYARTLMKLNRDGGTIDLETHGSARDDQSF